MKRTVLIMTVIICIGTAVIALSVSADYTGLNFTQESKEVKDFGWVQTFSLILGANIVVTALMVGLYVLKIKHFNRKQIEFLDDEEEDGIPLPA